MIDEKGFFLMVHLLLLLSLPFMFSFNFSPMSQSIEVEGKKAAQFLIENDGASNVAVELTVRTREMNENGEEVLTDTSDLAVFPPQVIIPPGEKRTIRVNYTLKDIPQIEKNYRVIAEQLPLKVDKKTKDQAGIKMLMKYVAALYVTPSDAKPEIKLISHSGDGKDLKLTVENSGKRHQLLTNPVVKFIHEGKKGEFKTSDLTGMAGENVLAGQKRTFTIKTSKAIPEAAKVELKIND
jgi:fimbrial chaperone protein